jgi:hypothetical protein
MVVPHPVVVGFGLPEGFARAAEHPIGFVGCVAFQTLCERGDGDTKAASAALRRYWGPVRVVSRQRSIHAKALPADAAEGGG